MKVFIIIIIIYLFIYLFFFIYLFIFFCLPFILFSPDLIFIIFVNKVFWATLIDAKWWILCTRVYARVSGKHLGHKRLPFFGVTALVYCFPHASATAGHPVLLYGFAHPSPGLFLSDIRNL